MRKRELVFTHSLLVIVRRHLAERDDIAIPTDAFDAYDDGGVRPTALAERKDAHRDAVGQLLEGLTTTLTAQQRVADAPSTSSDPASASPSQQ